MSSRLRTLAFLLLLAGYVLLLGCPGIQGQEFRAVRVPFVGCASDGQNGAEPPPNGAARLILIDANAAERLAYYEIAYEDQGVLAPLGWYCFGLHGSGGFDMFVAPQPMKYEDFASRSPRRFAGPVIELNLITSAASGRIEAARIIARMFPAQKAFVQLIIRGGILPSDIPFGPYPHDELVSQSDRLVEYQTPPHSEGLGTDSQFLQANGEPINGAAILQGHDVTILNVRLQSNMSYLTPGIIHQFERENRGRSAKQMH